MRHPLHVAIDARLVSGTAGGVEQGVIQLVATLGVLTDGDETYTILVNARSPSWVEPYLGSNQRIVPIASQHSHNEARIETRLATFCWRVATPAARVLSPLWRKVVIRRRRQRLVHAQSRSSDDVFLPLGVDLVHVPYQRLVHTSLPVIFEPWDLQHRHLTKLFPADDRAERDLVYVEGCSEAAAVVVGSRHVAADLVEQLGLDREKIYRIRRGPPVARYGNRPSNRDLLDVRARLALPDHFVFFPAQTWPHKNHLQLLDAIAFLRDYHGLRVPAVCSGTLTQHYEVIRHRLDDLRLHDQVRFLGFVAPADIRALYRLATILVFPSLFEGYGFPVLEAFHEDLACTCSDLNSLSELAGQAALLFNPHSSEAIAAAIGRLWVNPDLRSELVRKGQQRLRCFDEQTSARTFRALYRHVSGYPVNADDRHLLQQALGWADQPRSSLAQMIDKNADETDSDPERC